MRTRVILNTEDQNIKIVRSRNYKRLSLSVASNGRIRVSAPSFVPIRQINKFIDQYIDQVRIRNTVKPQNYDKAIIDNGSIAIPFLDNQTVFKIKIIASGLPGIKVIDLHNVIIKIPEDIGLEQTIILKKYVKKFYREQARSYFISRADHYCGLLNTKYKRIRIGDQTSRWGSCSGRGTLSYNLRLMMAPLNVADYVALHEVAHLIEGNHSVKFWKIVEDENPDFRLAKKWLKDNGKELWKFF